MHGGDIYTNNIKYDFSVNINPFMPSEEVLNCISEAAGSAVYYPEIGSDSLTRRLSEKLSIKKDYIVMTNGASEGIVACVNALTRIDLCAAVIIEPAFSGYERALKAAGVSNIRHISVKISDKAETGHMGEALLSRLKSVKEESTGNSGFGFDGCAVFLASPSNPTGQQLEVSEIKSLYEEIKSENGYMFLDECFINLSDSNSTMIDVIRENPGYYDRLFILRSFTKTYSIPGIRLGYIVSSSEELCQKIKNCLPEWNISSVAEKAGIKCLDEDISGHMKRIKKEREYLYSELNKLKIKTYPSASVYIMLEADESLYNRLLSRGILIRDCSDYYGLEKGIFRISVKTHEENEILINAIKEVYNVK